MVDKVIIEARVTLKDEGYLAIIDALNIEAVGESVQDAQDNLVKSFRAWLETCEEAESLGESLAEVGYPGVEEDTELELHFVE